jgi:hypothetical protein
MTEEQEMLWVWMHTASVNLRNAAGYKAGQGKENAYAQAYKTLVRNGLAFPLKQKYTG